jgi:hypothetical protein
MKDLRWMFAAASVGLAGAIALAIAAAPPAGRAGATLANDPVEPVASVPAPELAAAPVAAAPVAAAPRAATPAARRAAPVPSSGIVPGSAGMVIAIDPETGQVGMPSSEQLAELKLTETEAISHEDDGLTQVRHADGSFTVHLQGRYQEYAVIRKAADGTTVTGCVDHPAKADHLHPAPAALEEE